MTTDNDLGLASGLLNIAVPVSYVRELFCLWSRLEHSNPVFGNTCGQELGKCADFGLLLELEATIGRFQAPIVDASASDHALPWAS